MYITAFLFQTETICESCAESNVFQSCENFPLYTNSALIFKLQNDSYGLQSSWYTAISISMGSEKKVPLIPRRLVKLLPEKFLTTVCTNLLPYLTYVNLFFQRA